jgi:hypothetical protein
MVNTCPSNINVHPGLSLLSGRKKKCTRDEIERDEAHAKADTLATREATEASQHEDIVRIAAMENSIQQEDDARQAHANRPDLCYGSQSSNVTQTFPGRTLSQTSVSKPAKPSHSSNVSDNQDDEDEGKEDEGSKSEANNSEGTTYQKEVDPEPEDASACDEDDVVEEENIDINSPPASTVLNTESDTESDSHATAKHIARKNGKVCFCLFVVPSQHHLLTHGDITESH